VHACYELLAVLPVDLALRFRKGARLDQQTLSFIAAPAFAETYHHGVPRAFRPDPAREQRIPGRQKFEIVEACASQACRARAFHDGKIARPAASVAFPGIAQWLDDQGPRLARSTERSCLFGESSPEIQSVRYSFSIVGLPLLLKRSVCRNGVRAM
jgi:hypothetical protein